MKAKRFTRQLYAADSGTEQLAARQFHPEIRPIHVVLEKTGSAAVFAGLLAAAMLPTILLSPFGGILADRKPPQYHGGAGCAFRTGRADGRNRSELLARYHSHQHSAGRFIGAECI